MSENITLGTVSSFANDSSAVATVNFNSSNIETAFTDCLSLSGGQPNAMQSNLDMNKFQVLNLPPPATLLSPVRLTDVVTNGQIITVNTLPVGGSTNALLHKNSGTDYDATWTLTPSGTITIPATTDTLMGKATTDILTNKTYDTAGTGNVFKINGTGISAITGTGSVVLAISPTITTPGIVGVTNASSATAGNVGEVLSSTLALGSAISVTTDTALNITSLVLTAGDWQVTGSINYLASVNTQTQGAYICSLSTTSATLDLTNGRYRAGNQGNTTYNGTGLSTLLTAGIGCGPIRFNVNAPTTVFLVGQS